MTDDRKRKTADRCVRHDCRRALAESRAEVAELREIARHAYRVAVLCDPYVRASQHPASNSLEALAFNLRGEIDALSLEPTP